MNLGFTGTRQGMSERQRDALERLFQVLAETSTFRHGCCIGADTEASKIAGKFPSIKVIGYPPTNTEKADSSAYCDETLPPQNYISRNHSIVDDCDILIAAPIGRIEWQRSGTWATVRYAQKIGRPCIILDR